MTDIDPLVERLLKSAQQSSDIDRMMMEAKSLRQTDNPEGRTDLYSYATPEMTIQGQAADRIQSDAKVIDELRVALKQAQDHVCMAYCHFGNGDYEDASEHKPICVDLRATLEQKKEG